MALATLMSNPIIQGKILYLIVEIEQYLYHPSFLTFLREAAGSDSFRFYMKGSSAARLHLATSLPVPLTSDFDMVLLVDPTLSQKQYSMLRSLLIGRLLEVYDNIVERSANFLVGYETLPPGRHQASYREMYPTNSDDTLAYLRNIFESKATIKAPDAAQLTYKFTNSLVTPNSAEKHTPKGFSLLKLIPRTPIRIDSILDIIIPSHDYKNVFYDWAASAKLTPFKFTINNKDMQIQLLNVPLLDADLRRSEETETRAEKLASRRGIVGMLEFSRLKF